MTYGQALADGRERLWQAGLTEADWEAWLLFAEAFEMERSTYLLHSEEAAPPDGLRRYADFLRQRLQRRPTAYITGSRGFMGLDFQVDERVLIPRQDTETLVEEALERLKGKGSLRVLDLCTGSGCIAVSLAHYCPQAEVWASDISEQALEAARENARRCGASVRFCAGDLFDALPAEAKGSFGLIVSNPPYVTKEEYEGLEPEVREYEPAGALVAEKDGLAFYERIAAQAAEWLGAGGQLGVEIGCTQGLRVAQLLEEAGFRSVVVRQDLNGLDRTVWGER